MNNKEIFDNLCVKDERNPDYYDLFGYEIESDIKAGYTPDIPTPRKDCFCDNCFSGRDRLAMELIKRCKL